MVILTHPPSAIRIRCALLNDTLRNLSSLYDGRGVALLTFDPGRYKALKALKSKSLH